MVAELLTAETLRERLNRDLPGVVVTPEPAVSAEGTPAKDAKDAKNPADMLATNDTIVVAERLPEVLTYVRDVLGYSFLSDITAVDYLAADLFELVYLLYHPAGGTHLMIKVRVPRDNPDVPSLTPIWPGAELSEREAFDLFGINFIDHPYLKRIYLWDEFEGHPMRKDFPKQGDKYLDEE